MPSEKDADKHPSSDKSLANSRNLIKKDSRGTTDSFLDSSKTPFAPDQVNVPTPKTGKSSDILEGLEKEKIEGEKVMTKNGSSYNKSAGDEPGSIKQIVNNKVETISQKVHELLGYYRTLDDVGKQLLASSLILGLLAGGAVPFLYYSNVNSRNREEIGQLRGLIEEEQATNLLLQTAVDNCTEQSLSLEEEVDELGSILDDRESEISVLQDKVSELYSYNQVYIKEATIDFGDELIHLMISNPTDYNNVATRLTVISGLLGYADESEDATGYLYSDSETRLTWNMEEAQAPPGFLSYDRDYLVMMTTITNYTCLHRILPVEVTIRVDRWDYNNDKVLLETEWEHSIYPNISSIGLKKVGSDDERYYNASDCLIDEWYEGELYAWKESAASAPPYFLSEGSAYLVRISFTTPSERCQMIQALGRYSFARKYTMARIDTTNDRSTQIWE